MTNEAHVVRHVIRRVRYATNVLALESDLIPPEGPLDAALTNGLLVIVSAGWPGQEVDPKTPGRMLPARALLDIIETEGGLPYVDNRLLREALDLTQPFRHGRADDEFATVNRRHLDALRILDEDPGLRFLETARGLRVDEALLLAFEELTDQHLPFDPKDRLDNPEPEECPECWRTTFLPQRWDMFGGTITEGFCVACGYERTEDEAYEDAIDDQLRERMNDDT